MRFCIEREPSPVERARGAGVSHGHPVEPNPFVLIVVSLPMSMLCSGRLSVVFLAQEHDPQPDRQPPCHADDRFLGTAGVVHEPSVDFNR